MSMFLDWYKSQVSMTRLLFSQLSPLMTQNLARWAFHAGSKRVIAVELKRGRGVISRK